MSKPPPMGHNGGFFFESREDFPPDLPKMHFFKCFIQDILDDVLKLPNDERGFYLTALLVMYKEMEGLPADDKQAAMSMLLDVRQYRRLRDKVIARGLLYQRPTGRISNHRFEAEICAYVTEFKNRREAAIERERKRRDARTSHTLTREVSEMSQRSVGDLREISRTSPKEMIEDFSKNANEINETIVTREPRHNHEAPTRARVLELELEREVRKKENLTTTTESDQISARGGGEGDRFASLNGTAESMLDFISKYALVARPNARDMLTTNVQVFGPDIMMKAHVITIAKMTEGVVARPYKFMIATAQKLMEEKARAQKPPAATPEAKCEHWLRETVDGREMARSLGWDGAKKFYFDKVAPRMGGAHA